MRDDIWCNPIVLFVKRKEMNCTITAIYENGILRPLSPLDLPEQSQVELDVRQVIGPSKSAKRHQIHEVLVSAGLVVAVSEPISAESRISSERRKELAEIFSSEKPLAELISEDRD
jgi:predicted DNA-binding antitoxin AbrB/MazE fold protein